MSKVLITGADGFTGRYLAKELSNAGHEVHGLVHLPVPEGVEGVAQLHVANLCDLPALSAVMKEVQPEKVAHLAAIAFVAHSDVSAIYNTNLVGTRNLLEALVLSKSALTSVLLASSANIYGNSVGGVLDESTPAAPANDYAVSKLAMEYAAALYAERLPIVVARPFNYTGIGQSDSFLIPKIVKHVRSLAPVIELGNLHVARDFSDVRMVVQYYRRLLETDGAVGQTFNVCSGDAHTLDEVLAFARSIADYEFEVKVNPAFVRENEVKVLVGHCGKLQSVVGKIPVIPLVDTLRWMIEARH